MSWQSSGNSELIAALQETISYLRKSKSSVWAGMSVDEIVQELESEIARAQNSRSIDTNLLRILFAPAGAIQDTSNDNDWGDEFLRISEIVDRYIASGSKDL